MKTNENLSTSMYNSLLLTKYCLYYNYLTMQYNVYVLLTIYNKVDEI